MSNKTRREIDITDAMSAPVREVIKMLSGMAEDHPEAELDVTTESEYGERYEKVYFTYYEDKTPIELELDRLRAKRREYEGLAASSRSFKAYGKDFPEADKLAALRSELGAAADSNWELVIVGDEICLYGFEGVKRLDGTWKRRLLSALDFIKED